MQLKITSIEKRDGVWHVAFTEGGMIGSRIYSDPYRLLQFLVDSGFVLDRISYDALKGQVFSEKVTVVGNAKEWPVRGYRDPSPIDEYEVDIETVMGDIETFYKERSSWMEIRNSG